MHSTTAGHPRVPGNISEEMRKSIREFNKSRGIPEKTWNGKRIKTVECEEA